MVQMNGKFKLQANENLVQYLVALGTPEELAKEADGLRPTMEVIVNGQEFKILSDSGVKNASMTFALGVEFDDAMPTGEILKSTASVDGNKLIIKSSTPKGRTGERIFEFTDTQCILSMTSSISTVDAKRTYNRV